MSIDGFSLFIRSLAVLCAYIYTPPPNRTPPANSATTNGFFLTETPRTARPHRFRAIGQAQPHHLRLLQTPSTQLRSFVQSVSRRLQEGLLLKARSRWA